MASMWSSARRPRVWNGTPIASYSPGTYPTPMPTINRPRDSTSTEASCFARISGLRNGRITMPVPRRMRSVRAARNASVGTGSSISASGGSGDGGACGSIRTGCSPTQSDSNPSPSAASAISATPSASATVPEPTPNQPMCTGTPSASDARTGAC